MHELEKILEEIGRDIAGSMGRKREGLLLADKIIRKHMKAGWIPVEERLPEESLESVIGWDAYRERCCFVQCRNGRFYLSSGETVKIVAWQPLPEPYRAKS